MGQTAISKAIVGMDMLEVRNTMDVNSVSNVRKVRFKQLDALDAFETMTIDYTYDKFEMAVIFLYRLSALAFISYNDGNREKEEITMTEYHIAEINIARMIAPIDSDVMSGFTNRIDEINALAESSDGFVWRLSDSVQVDSYDNHFPDDNMIIVTMSVWESLEALHNYVYRSEHGQMFKQRKSWFSKMDSHHMVLWYIPSGEIPTVDEAKAKLAYLDQHGTTPNAFTFTKRFSVEEWLTTIN